MPTKYTIPFAVIRHPPTRPFLLLVIREKEISKDASSLVLVSERAKKGMAAPADLMTKEALRVVLVIEEGGQRRVQSAFPELIEAMEGVAIDALNFQTVTVEI